MRSKSFLIIIQLFIAMTICAQVNTEDIQLVIMTRHPGISLQYPEYVKEFYKVTGYNYVWSNNQYNTRQLLQLLQAAPDLGLQEEDYQFAFIHSFRNNFDIPTTHRDTLLSEIRLTDAALHFFGDIAYGNRKPAIGFDGLNYSPDCFNIPVLMATAITEKRLTQLVENLEPDVAGYLTLKNWLLLFNHSINDSSFKEMKITSARVNNTNELLVNRLYYLGIIDSLNEPYTDVAIKGKVRSAQRLFNLPDDGVLHKLTIEGLNVPVSVRIEEVKSAMNTLRWLRCAGIKSPVFIVNIPSATLMVVQNGKVLLQSKVIVGKKSTPTPTLASTITDVVLYPYWIVPNNIATRELLPLIKQNTGYLENNNMQVLNKAGKIIDPRTINWSGLSPSYFPYTLRQSTGCDNSLGIIKLNFYSPYSVYLHDTPWKVLFNFNKRYFSHGCIRVEKALEAAHFLLKENTLAIDTLEEKGCLRNQAPLPIPITEHIPVFVLYNTAWFDSTGMVQFNEDIYRKISFDQKKLKKTGE